MTRRSTPQAQIDEKAFPVRLLIYHSADGFGESYNPIHAWLVGQLGRTEFAWHSAGWGDGRQRSALFFRKTEVAAAFAAAFPELELADGTKSVWYTSPYLPMGRPKEDIAVCNLYNLTTAQEAMRQLFGRLRWTVDDFAGNVESGSYYPDQMAPIVRHGQNGLELAKARWGMPSPAFVLKTARDPGVTNVRNTVSPHWRRWLGPAHRCLVPVTSFAEPKPGGNQWFAPVDDAPAFFAGIEVRGWKSVRKVRDGETEDDLFAFLTCPPNAEVAAVHPKAMPVILTDPGDWETWMGAPFEMAMMLQRPLPDGALRLIAGPILARPSAGRF